MGGRVSDSPTTESSFRPTCLAKRIAIYPRVDFDYHFGIILQQRNPLFPGAAALVPTLGALLLILGNGRLSGWLLGNPVMVFVGLVSYSWYLWHWPLLSFARLSASQPLPLSATLTIVSLALVIAYLSYRYIETPFRQGWRLQESSIIRGYLSLIAILMLPTSVFI